MKRFYKVFGRVGQLRKNPRFAQIPAKRGKNDDLAGYSASISRETTAVLPSA